MFCPGVGDLMKDNVAQSLKQGYTMRLCDTSPRSKSMKALKMPPQ